MAKLTKLLAGKPSTRRHFIVEWAEALDMTRADIARELDIDKSQTSRWFAGQMPQPEYQKKIADLFGIAPDALFRHPDADWMSKLFEDRPAEERERMKQAIELTWPPKS